MQFFLSNNVTGQGNQAAAAEKLTMGNPPPYSPPSQQQLQQMPTPQREYIQFIQHNPQGFVLQQQPDQPQTEWFSDISDGYCYDQPMSQQMPPGQMTSTQSTVMVRTKIIFLKRNPLGIQKYDIVSPQQIVRRTLYIEMTTSSLENVPLLACVSELSILDCPFGFL